MQEQGIIACAKHFPGHGDTRVDSHLELPVVEEDPDRLLSRELLPFKASIQAEVGTIMTAHVLYPAFDEDYPATMSERIQSRILRKKLGFKGVLISDDLEMKALRGRYPLEQQLEKATLATVDVFLACKEPLLQHQCWETLVYLQENDKFQDKAAIQSVKRVFYLREAFLKNRSPRPELSILGCEKHRELAIRVRVEGEE
jgi:beta-N-acetylhexosaminidase